MEISYEKLWEVLIDKNMKKQDLQHLTGLSKATITKLGKNEDVSTSTLRKICTVLECNIEDIIETIKIGD